jgi:gluconate:H+ symporter, GntP family
MNIMPCIHAALLFASVIILIVAARRHVHPFLALVVVATAFGLACGLSIGQLAKSFGAGFSEKIYSPGLAIIAAGFVAGLAESTGASDRLTAIIDRWRWLGPSRIATLLGLIAGIGASPASAFALLTPLVRPIAGEKAQARVAATLALAISASHGLVLLAPVPIAAAAILGAEWHRVALFGLPLAVLLAAAGAAYVRWLPFAEAASSPPPKEPFPAAQQRSGRSPLALFLAAAIPLLLLMEQSLGEFPSEPLGGGPARELVIGLGRPLILFLAAVGVMTIGNARQGFKLLGDSTWTARVLANVASILLIVCAAGGLQALCQETGMAELIGERLSGWPIGAFGGVLVPFLVAAALKTLQGSSLVAAIAAAGIVQPILAPLGLSDANTTALAALAIGTGAMTVSHVNDEYFWLVTDRAGLSLRRGLAAFSGGMLLQGLIAAAVLLLLSALV